MAKLQFLKTEKDFGRFKRGRLVQGPNLKIRFISSSSQNPRFGFIVPKKILKKATDRNLIKRRLKFMLNKHQHNIKSFDVLFFPRATSLQRKFADLEAEVSQLFTQARLWKS